MVVDWRWAREGWLSSWGRQSEWRANSRPIHSPPPPPHPPPPPVQLSILPLPPFPLNLLFWPIHSPHPLKPVTCWAWLTSICIHRSSVSLASAPSRSILLHSQLTLHSYFLFSTPRCKVNPFAFLSLLPIHLMPCPSFSILTSSSQKKTLSLCKGVRRERCLVNKLC